MKTTKELFVINRSLYFWQKAVKENRLFPRYNLILMTLTLVVADLGGLLLAAMGAAYFTAIIGGRLTPDRYFNLFPFIFIFLISYSISGLYPGVGLSFVDELRKLSLSTTITVALITAYFFVQKSGISYSRLAFIFFWIATFALVPISRWLVRGLVIRTGNWGEPIAIIGNGEKSRRIVNFLQNNRQLGYLPIAIIHDFHVGSEQFSETLKAIPIHEIEKNRDLMKDFYISSAILVPTETPDDFRQLILEDRQFGLRKLILISSLQWIGGSAVIARDINGILGLELQRNLLNPFDRAVKLILTSIIFLATCWITIPVIFLCALFVFLDSKGPIFYGHKRIGQDAKEIKVWKFRTMEPDADEVLKRCLESNPELRKEWEATHKLKDDPRITRVGNWLRRTSLDELPQLWNVLKGEMSLVGPRPIVQDEVSKYKNSFRLYSQVKPGMTGLWQISGRNDINYDERVSLDEYYVRHWTVWMDIYILIRTVWIVLRRSGAY